MADEISEQTPKGKTNALHRNRRPGLIAAGTALALGALVLGGWSAYRHFRPHEQISDARPFVPADGKARADLGQTGPSESARLEATRERDLFNFTLLGLSSANDAEQALARSTMEQWADDPNLHGAARNALISDALKRRDHGQALRIAAQIVSAPGATFEDRLVQLEVLRQLKRKEFWWCLAMLQKQAEAEWSEALLEGRAADGLGTAAILLSWLNRRGLASAVVDWSQRMPGEMPAQVPVRIDLVDAHYLLRDWKAVKNLTQAENWGPLDWKRKALNARALREEGDENGWNTRWNGAVSMSRESPERLAQLARYAEVWKWDDQLLEVLWLLAADRRNRAEALTVLNEKYAAAGKTRELLRVARSAREADPEHPGPKNNVAYLSMLLASDLDEAYALAAEVYQQHPTNPVIAATQAYALHLQRRTREGLKILRQLGGGQLAEPSIACCYGILLAADGSKDEARRYLDLAARGNLLPEERALIAEVK